MPLTRSKKQLYYAVAAIIMIGIGYFWYNNSRYQYFITTPVNPNNGVDAAFMIKKGDTVPSIAKKLHDKDLILDEDAFKAYAKQNNIDRKIIAGKFLLNQTMTIPDISAKITNPTQGELTLTIPEGSTLAGIDDRLTALGAIQTGEFIQAAKEFKDYKKYSFLDGERLQKLPHPLEGYLFPDTYYINLSHYNNSDLIDLMLKNFQKKIKDYGYFEVATKNGGNFYDIITMASIIEKEVKTTQDRPIIAGIFWKRLEQNWQLGADATLLYLKNDRTIDAKDLQEDSPYNTRKNRGLPPGPICNPGIKSIEAAIDPQSSEYMYYLTKPGTGEVVYAKTNDEHNANRAAYLN